MMLIQNEEVVPVDIHIVAALGSDDRCRWLTKALHAVAAGAARPSDVWDIVSHRRFAAASRKGTGTE